MRKDLSDAYAVLLRELIAARKAAGLSQREVAARLGALQQFWSKVESGERRIDIAELVAVAEVLPINFDDLLSKLRATVKASRRKK